MLQDDDMPVDDAPADEGDGAPRQSYNFAPGYHGIVYRADVPDSGAGPRNSRKGGAKKTKTNSGTKSSNKDATSTTDQDQHDEADADATTGAQHKENHDGGDESENSTQTHYKLQSMKWGLVPFWTKRNPDYAAVMKTINCRDDSLATTGGMWQSMKGRKRCIVVAQGFYEWLKSGKERVPHFVKRKDGKLMYFAGLWDCVQYDEDKDDKKNYTYTIITTDSNKQLKFLHDRMPVILDPASGKLKTWLDPGRYEWSQELQDILKPFEGELEVYPVSKEVGKVGNNSPSFIIPIASRENNSNIANFFANAAAAAAAAAQKKTTGKDSKKNSGKKEEDDENSSVEVENGTVSPSAPKATTTTDELIETADDGGVGISPDAAAGTKKRKAKDTGNEAEGEPPLKKEAISSSPTKNPVAAKNAKTISSTRNGTKSPAKSKAGGTPKITNFFGNSA